MITEIEDQDFNSEVLQSDTMVFACFTAPWCSSCFPTCMSVKSIAKEYDQKVKFVRCDIEQCTEVAKRYSIGVLPTILLFRNSEIVKKVIGFQEKGSLRRLLKAHLQE